MRTIIFSVVGTSGDINPLLAIAIQMKKMGFEVVFLTNEHFIPILVNVDMNYFVTGTEKEYQLGNSKECWDYRKEDNSMFGLYHAPTFRRSYEYVMSAFNKNKNLIVVTLFAYDGARAAAEKLGLPKISIILSPNVFFSYTSPPAPFCWLLPNWLPTMVKKLTLGTIRAGISFANSKNKWNKLHLIERKKIGALKIDASYKNELLNICLFPEWFGMRQPDWKKNIKLVGFPIFKLSDSSSEKAIDKFIKDNGAPILFTTGTGVQDTEMLFCEAQKICASLKKPGLFVGGNGIQKMDQDLPYFKHIKYVDFEYILPKCAVIVHHGGIGTTAAAIRAGIPQLIRPLKYDQPDNANRVHKLGLGYFVLPKFFKAETVAPILKDLIAHAPTNTKLKMYASDLNRNNAIDKACNMIKEKIQELEVV